MLSADLEEASGLIFRQWIKQSTTIIRKRGKAGMKRIVIKPLRSKKQLRKIAYLSYLGYTQEEIAKEMGITQSLVSRKLKKIRKEIENAYG